MDLTQSGRKVTIQGAGVGKSIIDAQQIDRVFQIFGGVTVIFKNLTIRNGLAQDDGTAGDQPGDSDAWGGGILSQGANLTLNNVALCNNIAQGAAGPTMPLVTGGAGNNAYGGGMYIDGGTATLTSITVQGNSARGGDGVSGGGGYGGYAYGGGIFATNIACLTLTGSKVLENCATGGGTAIGSGICDQSGNAYGGGIASTSPVSLTNCLVSRNTAQGGDGADAVTTATPAVSAVTRRGAASGPWLPSPSVALK